jgi:hypothetical protein
MVKGNPIITIFLDGALHLEVIGLVHHIKNRKGVGRENG